MDPPHPRPSPPVGAHRRDLAGRRLIHPPARWNRPAIDGSSPAATRTGPAATARSITARMSSPRPWVRHTCQIWHRHHREAIHASAVRTPPPRPRPRRCLSLGCAATSRIWHRRHREAIHTSAIRVQPPRPRPRLPFPPRPRHAVVCMPPSAHWEGSGGRDRRGGEG